VLIVHAWKGITDYERGRARQLAELGFVAFCADIYGQGVRPVDNQAAGAEAGKYRADRPLLRARAQAGLDALKSLPQVDSARIAAIGYCFGGGTVLELARSGAELAGVVSFHGNLDTPLPAEPGAVKAKVLVLHGADDPHVTMEHVAGLAEELRAAGADWQLAMYGGAVHAFTDPGAGDDPSKGAAYSATADARSWQAMLDFFAEVLQ
jgi:dienelactone hydrolase